ncbi:hypothetical protein N7478_006137 [Penicillium angulare]|uniref:uncharacterized protein n=1 Tax=Penicillium angulare TaxID=116970 RepID=UPI002540D1F3|nr:uncharacterized protein N7478_006137 [Penicillium angulare]KAJ5280765.1 hypothetical protein N7478_006137 [Penicillium angulare]
MPTKDGRITKSKIPRQSSTPTRRVSANQKTLPLVERTNALSIQDFISAYVSRDTPQTHSTIKEYPHGPTESDPLAARQQNDTCSKSDTSLDVYSASTIPAADLEACLNLIELTSSEAYAASGVGWSRTKKRKEMQLPDMKYLIVRDSALTGNSAGARVGADADADRSDGPAKDEDGTELGVAGSEDKSEDSESLGNKADKGVLGFLSFMVTYEDGKEVVYCYEIHLSAEARGRGLGGLLMKRMEEIGRSVGLEKTMLTVFKSNMAACRFYEKGGYVVDEHSPQPRKLRNGTIKEFDYLILSKRLSQ